MIAEVRNYRIKPGRREEFIQFFEAQAVPALSKSDDRVTHRNKTGKQIVRIQ